MTPQCRRKVWSGHSGPETGESRGYNHRASTPEQDSDHVQTRRLRAARRRPLHRRALGQQAPAPQAPRTDPPPVIFRVEVDYVEVDALVADAQSNLVSDLTRRRLRGARGRQAAEGHRVLAGEHPDRACRAAALCRPGPSRSTSRPTTTVEGRIYLLVLDDLHTDFTRTPRVKAAARRFIEQNFGTNDLAAVVFTGRGEDAQDFTNNHAPAAARHRQVHRPQAPVGHDQPAAEHAGQPRHGRARPGDDIDRAGAGLPRAQRDGHHPPAGRVHGRRARPAQGAAARGRGRGLQHLRGGGPAGLHGVVRAARHPRRHRRGHARQRQHLRHRSARARDRRRGSHHARARTFPSRARG